ncbi:helix-turn-helix domain-containing protein [Octadecabacter sp. SW4]|uniref:XRE family transcriptional regulator n=1 Tax=Octadecabacter sp. SW4 TaxID=2602067 RepID=UPI0011C1EC87|nr:XRE family transcriptional regulator [Octadecabacter sp. SW4]QEE35259.1 helix-turn-helix domain-containing protein [Octadecabacter sp. SW4]
MPQSQLTGTRIRDRRMDQGMRQADLARAAGISPSYLNLIEHNRRRIGGKLVNDISRVLGIDPTLLTEGAESGLLEGLRGAAADLPDTGAELARTEEFAGRFPGWAAVLAAQHDQLGTLKSRIETLTDRLTHDPQIATSLHEVITAVTAIRATSSILADGGEIDADWQRRFHRNLYEDSQRLAESSRALVGFLDLSGADANAVRSPQEQLEAWLEGQGYHVAALEGGDGAAIDALVQGRDPGTAFLMRDHLTRYVADAQALPLDGFSRTARACAYDPAQIVQQTGASLPQVLRRLASLPADADHPPFGLVIADGAGVVRLIKPVTGFAFPRAAACPMWPVFQSLAQIGQPLRQIVDLPRPEGLRFQCYAIAQHVRPPDFDTPPVTEAVMLVCPPPDQAAAKGTPAGTSCRICPRENCAARRAPSILSEVGAPL